MSAVAAQAVASSVQGLGELAIVGGRLGASPATGGGLFGTTSAVGWFNPRQRLAPAPRPFLKRADTGRLCDSDAEQSRLLFGAGAANAPAPPPTLSSACRKLDLAAEAAPQSAHEAEAAPPPPVPARPDAMDAMLARAAARVAERAREQQEKERLPHRLPRRCVIT